jgi:hypothetical protein
MFAKQCRNTPQGLPERQAEGLDTSIRVTAELHMGSLGS